MTDCPCEICVTCRRYETEGVPHLVAVSACNSVGVAMADEIRRRKSMTLEQYTQESIERLNGILSEWQKIRKAANQMITLGLIDDSEFYDAVSEANPAKSANLYQRIKDFAKSRAH